MNAKRRINANMARNDRKMWTEKSCRDLSGLFVDDGFDAVAVGIEHEGGEVMGAVLGMKAGSAIVFPAVLNGCPVECCDGFSGRSGKGNMKAFARDDDSLWSELNGEFVVATG